MNGYARLYRLVGPDYRDGHYQTYYQLGNRMIYTAPGGSWSPTIHWSDGTNGGTSPNTRLAHMREWPLR
jgi:hypothetical protein